MRLGVHQRTLVTGAHVCEVCALQRVVVVGSGVDWRGVVACKVLVRIAMRRHFHRRSRRVACLLQRRRSVHGQRVCW